MINIKNLKINNGISVYHILNTIQKESGKIVCLVDDYKIILYDLNSLPENLKLISFYEIDKINIYVYHSQKDIIKKKYIFIGTPIERISLVKVDTIKFKDNIFTFESYDYEPTITLIK